MLHYLEHSYAESLKLCREVSFPLLPEQHYLRAWMPRELQFPLSLCKSPTPRALGSHPGAASPGSGDQQQGAGDWNWFNNHPPPTAAPSTPARPSRRSTLQEEYEEGEPTPATELRVLPAPCSVMRTVCNRAPLPASPAATAAPAPAPDQEAGVYQHRAFINICSCADPPLPPSLQPQQCSAPPRPLTLGQVERWVREGTLYILVNSPKLGVAVVPVAASTPGDKQPPASSSTRSRDIMIYDVILSDPVIQCVREYLAPWGGSGGGGDVSSAQQQQQRQREEEFQRIQVCLSRRTVYACVYDLRV